MITKIQELLINNVINQFNCVIIHKYYFNSLIHKLNHLAISIIFQIFNFFLKHLYLVFQFIFHKYYFNLKVFQIIFQFLHFYFPYSHNFI